MHLFIGLVVVVCLFCCDSALISPVSNVGWRLIAVLVATLCVPGLACFQSAVFTHRLAKQNEPKQLMASVRAIMICHTTIWFLAVLFIFSEAEWHHLVRGNWALDRWPLLDEFLIAAPMVLSMTASWAAFYGIQKTLHGADDESGGRMSFVAIRFRVYFAIFLVPVFLLALLRDAGLDFDSFTFIQTTIVGILSLLFLLASFPLLMQFLWRTGPIDNPDLRDHLRATCAQEQMRMLDIRVWKTGNQVINAVVTGVLPRLKILMLSDRLLQLFPQNELSAIVRHEAGHVKLYHLPIRVLLALMPMLAFAVFEHSQMLARIGDREIVLPLFVVGYIGYLFAVVCWLSRNMEFEADLFAIGSFDESLESTERLQRARDMSDALLRFAKHMPEQIQRGSLTHPSLIERARMIKAAVQDPSSAQEFRRQFLERQVGLAACIAAACTALTWI